MREHCFFMNLNEQVIYFVLEFHPLYNMITAINSPTHGSYRDNRKAVHIVVRMPEWTRFECRTVAFSRCLEYYSVNMYLLGLSISLTIMFKNP